MEIRSLSKLLFFNELYKKRALYINSVLKKSIATYKNSGILLEQPHIDNHHNLLYFLDELLCRSETPLGKEREIYRNTVFKNQMENLKRKPRKQAFNEIMEKLSILSFMVGFDAELYMDSENNLFKFIFDNYFENEDENYLELFNEKHEKYEGMLQKIWLAEQKLTENWLGKGRNYIMPFKDAMKILENKESKGYITDLLRNNEKMKTIESALWAQIEENIKKREKEGIPQTHTRLLLKRFNDKQFSDDNIKLVNKLIAEANTQLQLLKLPSFYKDHENTMIETIKIDSQRKTKEKTDLALLKTTIAKENVKENLAPQIEGMPKLFDIYDYKEELKNTDKDEDEENEENNNPEIKKIFGEDKELAKIFKNEKLENISDKTLSILKDGKLIVKEDNSMIKHEQKMIENAPQFTEHPKSYLDKPKSKLSEYEKWLKLSEMTIQKGFEIRHALENGIPMDDDLLYRKILRKSRKYQKIREEATGKKLDPELLKRKKIGVYLGEITSESDEERFTQSSYDIISMKKSVNKLNRKNKRKTK